MDPLIRARALHITGENERVLAGVAALESGQMQKFGELMFESHESSRRNFENSTSFLDALVEIASETQGVLGARLTGGGFGGATIWLVEKSLRGLPPKKWGDLHGAHHKSFARRPVS
ncbi:MAG TPA: hypothetical protein VGF37_05225 [Chthoniobacterales bacterium]